MDSPSEPKMDLKAGPDSDSDPEVTDVNNLNRRVRVKKEEPDSQQIAGLNLMFDDFDNGDSESALSDYDSDISDVFDDEVQTHELSHGGIERRDGIDWFICGHYQIRQIPEPQVLMYPIKQLFDMLQYGSMVLDPAYQRDVVWDEHRSSMLITSMLMGYFVPPLIFNHKEIARDSPNGQVTDQRRICVDGKQRLTSIQKFMLGHIGIADVNSKKWYFCHPIIDGQQTTSNHNIMPKAVRDFFTSRRICGYEYKDLPKDVEENMFQLVQRGITLTPAEKMRAKSTEWAQFAKQYEEDYSIIINLAKQNRASGFRIVLTIFAMVQEVSGTPKKNCPNPTLQASPQSLEKLLDDKIPITPELKTRFKEIFDRFETLVKLSSDQLTATKYKVKKNSVFDPAPDYIDANTTQTFSPLELVGTAILVAFHMEKLTDAELLNGVKKLRLHLRVRHKDLRLNAQCWGTTWRFINKYAGGPQNQAAEIAAINELMAIPERTTRSQAAKRRNERSPNSGRRIRTRARRGVSASPDSPAPESAPMAGDPLPMQDGAEPEASSELPMNGRERSVMFPNVENIVGITGSASIPQDSVQVPRRRAPVDPRQTMTNEEYWAELDARERGEIPPSAQQRSPSPRVPKIEHMVEPKVEKPFGIWAPRSALRGIPSEPYESIEGPLTPWPPFKSLASHSNSGEPLPTPTACGLGGCGSLDGGKSALNLTEFAQKAGRLSPAKQTQREPIAPFTQVPTGDAANSQEQWTSPQHTMAVKTEDDRSVAVSDASSLRSSAKSPLSPQVDDNPPCGTLPKMATEAFASAGNVSKLPASIVIDISDGEAMIHAKGKDSSTTAQAPTIDKDAMGHAAAPNLQLPVKQTAPKPPPKVVFETAVPLENGTGTDLPKQSSELSYAAVDFRASPSQDPGEVVANLASGGLNQAETPQALWASANSVSSSIDCGSSAPIVHPNATCSSEFDVTDLYESSPVPTPELPIVNNVGSRPKHGVGETQNDSSPVPELLSVSNGDSRPSDPGLPETQKASSSSAAPPQVSHTNGLVPKAKPPTRFKPKAPPRINRPGDMSKTHASSASENGNSGKPDTSQPMAKRPAFSSGMGYSSPSKRPHDGVHGDRYPHSHKKKKKAPYRPAFGNDASFNPPTAPKSMRKGLHNSGMAGWNPTGLPNTGGSSSSMQG